MRFQILGSSSAGNSALICTDGCKVLIDAGFTGRRMEDLLAQVGVELGEIDAIFITHEHSDHVTGLRGLTRKQPQVKVFANATTARVVQERLPRRLNWQIFENGLPFAFRDLEVNPFSIPHDAYDPVGYRFSNAHADNRGAGSEGGGSAGADSEGVGGVQAPRSVCWLTDLGYVTEAIRRHARQCDLLVIEANHDPDMLERCQTRSWSTKQRIRGRHGHLSNQAAFDLLAQTTDAQWRHVCLAHISAECNSLEQVETHFAPLRDGERKLDIHIVDPTSLSPSAEFDLRGKATATQTRQGRAPTQTVTLSQTPATQAATLLPTPASTQAATQTVTLSQTPATQAATLLPTPAPTQATAQAASKRADYPPAQRAVTLTQIEIALNG